MKESDKAALAASARDEHANAILDLFRDGPDPVDGLRESYIKAEADYDAAVKVREAAWEALRGNPESDALRMQWVKAQGRARQARTELVLRIVDLRVLGVTIPDNKDEKLKPKQRQPSAKTLMAWADQGFSRATDGCKVELDGTCEHGRPSWLLYLNLI